jgi:diacylglycerol kinase
MVSELMLTEAPVEALPRALLVSWFSAEFCAASEGAFELEVLAAVLTGVLLVVVAALEFVALLVLVVLVGVLLMSVEVLNVLDVFEVLVAPEVLALLV